MSSQYTFEYVITYIFFLISSHRMLKFLPVLSARDTEILCQLVLAVYVTGHQTLMDRQLMNTHPLVPTNEAFR